MATARKAFFSAVRHPCLESLQNGYRFNWIESVTVKIADTFSIPSSENSLKVFSRVLFQQATQLKCMQGYTNMFTL